MKFPLEEHPFQPVQLTPEQCHAYVHVVDSILDETIGEYERFIHLESRTLNKKQWKSVKTRENLTVYKQIGGHAPPVGLQPSGSVMTSPISRSGSSASSSASASAAATLARNMHEWRLPKLLAVGNIAGTLDDVMYGVVAPDVKAMLLRSSYVNDELVDGGVLSQIKGATHDDPFQFLGVKWLVKAHPTALNAVVSPRDTVVVDGTGLRQLKNGDRIGYHVMHSLVLPECPQLKQHSILRGYLSSCYLFKQMRNGTVEVYMKTYVDPGGRLSESLATLSVANALIGCWKSVWCAQGKKLTWLIKTSVKKRMRRRRLRGETPGIEPISSSNSMGKKLCCEVCNESFRAYKSARGCQVCLKLVCSKCQITRKISHMQRGLQVKQMAVVGCKDCVAHAAQLSALEVARDEFVGKQIVQQSLMTDAHSVSDSDGESWTASGMTLLEGFSPKSLETPRCYDEAVRMHSPTSSDLIPLHQHQLHQQAPPHFEYAQPAPLGPPEPQLDDHRQQLWMQMNQLRIAAEQTYMITKQNEANLRFAPVE